MRSKLFPAALFVLISLISYRNIFLSYDRPASLFWDENYHIASAEKYLNGVFFLEPHPPLGKLLIALGEHLLHPNARTDHFLDTMRGEGRLLTSDFSFRGYRLFPVLLAALTPPVLFLTLLFLVGSPPAAFFGAALFALDNALLVHLRGAMLEGPQLFFIVLALLCYSIAKKTVSFRTERWAAAGFGLAFGCACLTKITAAVLLITAAFWVIRHRHHAARALQVFCLICAGFVFVFISAWRAHFILARDIRPKLDDGGNFGISEEYRSILQRGETGDIGGFATMLNDSIHFVKRYSTGVPQLNLCKPEENGSPVFFWPVGARSIDYLWVSDGELTRYLYLQCNPAVWFLGLLGAVVSFMLLSARLFFPQGTALRRSGEIAHFTLLYAGYLAAVALIPRVMYLYHYFVPLIFSFFLIILCFDELTALGKFRMTRERKQSIGWVAFAVVLGTFISYSPLTYFGPVSSEWIRKHALLRIWDLRCANCENVNGIATPPSSVKPVVKDFSALSLDGTPPISGQQEWGEPKRDRTPDNREIIVAGRRFESGFGVHAKSVLVYVLGGRYAEFRALVAVPDRSGAGTGSVMFEVHGDSELMYRSDVIRSGDLPVPIKLSLKDKRTLKLTVLDAGDGNENDHAVWVNPELVRAEQ